MSSFPELLVAARRRRGQTWTQEYLASKVGVSGVHIGYLERGKRDPSPDLVRALAEALGADVDQFLLAAGYAPQTMPGVRRPILTVLEGLGPLHYPPTPEEERVMDKAERRGVDIPDWRAKAFWERPAAKRRRTFQTLDMLLDDFAELAGEDDEEGKG